MSSIAIIGAGSSGLAAAHVLRDAGHIVTLFEEKNVVGGRATTGRQAGCIYDYGAQYIKSGAPESVALITERFRLPDLLDIEKPVWIFDGTGRIQEGDPVQNAEPKWSYRSGLVSLAQRMAEGLDIRLETSVASLQHTTAGWVLLNAAHEHLGSFEQVLITLPAPQAAALIKDSTLTGTLQDTICAYLAGGRYNPLISVMMGFQPAPQIRPYYALVNTDKKHAVSWLAWEHEKSQARVPAGTGLLLAQMAPHYSLDHWQVPDDTITADVVKQVAELLNEALPEPFFTDLYRWPYALPAVRVDADLLNDATLPDGLAFCGDAFVGGRVHLALEHGCNVAEKMLGH